MVLKGLTDGVYLGSNPFEDRSNDIDEDDYGSFKSDDSTGKHSRTNSTVSSLKSLRAHSVRGNPVFNRTMGLQKLDISTWLVVDNRYITFHNVRTNLFNTRRSDIIQTTDAIKVEEACEELLGMVSTFLLEKYTTNFGTFREPPDSNGKFMIRSRIVNNNIFDLEPPFSMHPLEICARLAMEDFNILIKDEATGEHHLQASATLFPAGWRLTERIGWSASRLHGLVPQWRSKLSKPVEHYFSRLTSESSMLRHAYFIQIVPAGQALQQTLFIQNPGDFYPVTEFDIDDVWLRTERQTFRRLPKSGAVVFTVKTDLARLSDVGEDELERLAVEVRSWPDDVAEYRGRNVWGAVVLDYVDDLTGIAYDDPF
jgi:hypothetical protein